MVDVSGPLQKFYRKLLRSHRYAGEDLPPSQAYYISRAIQDQTGEYFSPEHVWVSLWLEGLVNPDELTEVPLWYVEQFMGGVVPDIQKLKTELWKKYTKFLLEEKDIDAPF